MEAHPNRSVFRSAREDPHSEGSTVEYEVCSKHAADPSEAVAALPVQASVLCHPKVQLQPHL